MKRSNTMTTASLRESIELQTSFFDRLQELQLKNPAMMPLGDTLGFSVESLSPGRVVVRLDCDARHDNLLGAVHGGAIYTLADTAIGLAHLTKLNADQSAATVESKVNFLRPAWQGKLRAHAYSLKHGQTLSFLECDVIDGAERLIAKVNATMMTLDDHRARGRSKLISV